MPALSPAQHQEPCAAAIGTGISVWPRAPGDLYDRARFCEASGVPLTTRRLAAVATLTLRALDSATEQGVRPMTSRDCQRVTHKYLVPFLGKYLLTRINAASGLA